MPRGSKPGERRGGRHRATPNRRTVLTNRILAAAAANPAPTTNELVLVLAKDQDLPADTRMAIARKALLFGPSRSSPGFRSERAILEIRTPVKRSFANPKPASLAMFLVRQSIAAALKRPVVPLCV
jgi:hypothetical protein